MKDYTTKLNELKAAGNLRRLPKIVHKGCMVERDGQWMLNLSSNDYLGLASRADLRNAFLEELKDGNSPSPLPLPAC